MPTSGSSPAASRKAPPPAQPTLTNQRQQPGGESQGRLPSRRRGRSRSPTSGSSPAASRKVDALHHLAEVGVGPNLLQELRRGEGQRPHQEPQVHHHQGHEARKPGPSADDVRHPENRLDVVAGRHRIGQPPPVRGPNEAESERQSGIASVRGRHKKTNGNSPKQDAQQTSQIQRITSNGGKVPGSSASAPGRHCSVPWWLNHLMVLRLLQRSIQESSQPWCGAAKDSSRPTRAKCVSISSSEAHPHCTAYSPNFHECRGQKTSIARAASCASAERIGGTTLRTRQAERPKLLRRPNCIKLPIKRRATESEHVTNSCLVVFFKHHLNI